jgi:hypothetical protein
MRDNMTGRERVGDLGRDTTAILIGTLNLIGREHLELINLGRTRLHNLVNMARKSGELYKMEVTSS